eukprot:gene22553-29678_t
MDADPAFRKLVGYFESFHAADMQMSLCPSSAFAKHIRIELPLSEDLIQSSANPGWEPVSNKGGFHSHQAMFSEPSLRDNPIMQQFQDQLVQAVAEAELAEAGEIGEEDADELASELASSMEPPTSSWVNVNRHGHWNGLHDHTGASWSGVYYAKVPPAPPPKSLPEGHSGRLILRTAIGGFDGPPSSDRVYATDAKKPEGWCQYAYIDAAEGLLVLFPSWVLHGVMPLVAHAGPDKKGKMKGGVKGGGGAEGPKGGPFRVSLAFNFGEPEVAVPPGEGGGVGGQETHMAEKKENKSGNPSQKSAFQPDGRDDGVKRQEPRKLKKKARMPGNPSEHSALRTDGGGGVGDQGRPKAKKLARESANDSEPSAPHSGGGAGVRGQEPRKLKKKARKPGNPSEQSALHTDRGDGGSGQGLKKKARKSDDFSNQSTRPNGSHGEDASSGKAGQGHILKKKVGALPRVGALEGGSPSKPSTGTKEMAKGKQSPSPSAAAALPATLIPVTQKLKKRKLLVGSDSTDVLPSKQSTGTKKMAE